MKNDGKNLNKEELLALDKEVLVALLSTKLEGLSSKNEELTTKNKALEKTLTNYEAKLRQSIEDYERLMEQVVLANKNRFGSKSEKIKPGQLNLFNEAELFSSDLREEIKKNQPSTKNSEQKTSSTKPKQKHMLEDTNLRVEEIVHDLDETEKEGFECIGKETKKLLKYQPSEWYVEHHVYPKYRLNTEEETSEFKTAAMEAPLFSGSSITSSALAHIVSLKYNLGLPLYRIERDLQSQNVNVSRQTLSNWCVKASEDYLSHLTLAMQTSLLEEPILHADETTVKVLHHQDDSTNIKSYIWLYRSAASNKRPLLVYNYQPGRSHAYPLEFLDGYTGYLQTDGYKAYDKLVNVKRVGCLAHARRRFLEAKEVSNEKTEGYQIATELFQKINYIMALDKKVQKLSLEDKQVYRLEKEKPVLNQFKVLLIHYQDQVLEKSHLGKAIQYSLNQFDSFERVFEDPRLEWTNNTAERGIKPFVMGRKAWLFSNTTRGAKSSADLYSIVQSALENKLHVERYLTYVFDQMNQKTISSNDQFNYLLPNSESLPAQCYQTFNPTKAT